MADGLLYSCRCRFASFYLPATAVGSSSRVRSLLRFSGGGGFDAISGKGRRSLLLLLVLSIGDVVDGAIPGEQDVRLGFLFPKSFPASVLSSEMALWGLSASSLRRDVSFQSSQMVGCGFRPAGLVPAVAGALGDSLAMKMPMSF
jgi:hypothetical protein